jgi:tRNA nucleotidyltransferase/poly(A) polymerase
MRGVRYAGQLRGFDLDPAARSVLRAHSPGLGGVAAERVVTEWLAILDSDDWAATLELAWEVGAGQVVFGERRADAATRAWAGIDIATAESAGTDPDRDAPTGRRAGRLAALLFDLTAGGNADDLALTLTDRRWPKSLARTAARAAVWADQRPADERTLARLALLDPAAAEIAGRLAALLGAGATSRLIAMAVVARETRWVTGADLHRLGVEDGPGMGDLLAAAAEGQVRGRWDDAEAARAWVAEQSRARS